MGGVELLANGILPTRGSLMIDVVVVAMAAVLTVMTISIWLVRVQKKFAAHRSIQIILTILLSIAIVLFEIDVRFFTDWRELAEASPFYESGVVDTSLIVHLVFAIPTPFVWAFVIWMALKKIRWTEERYRKEHRFWGRIAAFMMLMTTLTGWVFYWLAFVASQ